MRRVCDIRRVRRMVGIGAPDRSLTPVSGMVAMTELMDRTKAIRLPAATSRSRGVTYRFRCLGNTKCRYQEAVTATLITVGTACLVRRNEPRRAPWVVSNPNG